MGGSAHILLKPRCLFRMMIPLFYAETYVMTTSEDRMIRILLVEEEALVRAALQKLLESWPECEVVGAAGSKEQTLELLQHLDPHVVLLARPGDGSEGLESVSELAQACQPAKLLVLIGESASNTSAEVVRLGARGAVCKHNAPNELRRAIQKVHEGRELWLDRASMAMLITVGTLRENQNSSLEA